MTKGMAKAKIDLAVALALGIPATIHTYPDDPEPVCVCEKTQGDDFAFPWNPSGDWEHAMAAAKKMLELPGWEHFVYYIQTALSKADLDGDLHGANDTEDTSWFRLFPLFVKASPELICEAIIASRDSP